ncbi:hypothetical protein HDU80_008148 [Chytriomyces hyalinus]|nr:hypothetical protein HDU80_008148 [Chytriomyces hyalinus]
MYPYFALSILAALTQALPNGAPRCKITETTIQTGHLTAQSPIGITMTAPASYTPGGPAVPITITGKMPATYGVLGYVTPGTTQDSLLTQNGGGAAQHVGAFQNLKAQGMRPQSAASCQAQNVQNDAPESTFTHVAPMLGGQKTITMMWQPPAADVGPVTVNMVVAGNVLEPWQIVQSVQMDSAASPSPAGLQATNAGPVAKASGGQQLANIVKGAAGNVANVGGTLQDVLRGGLAGLGAH